LSHSTSFFCDGFFFKRVSRELFALCWLQTVILLISASWEAKDYRHKPLASGETSFFFFFFNVRTGVWTQCLKLARHAHLLLEPLLQPVISQRLCLLMVLLWYNFFLYFKKCLSEGCLSPLVKFKRKCYIPC
jgi:hypothetical protein